jgi:hypothetical protein
LTCIKRCLLDSHHDPHCINCRKEWSNEFVKSSFPSSWLNQEYRKNREIVLFEREKTFLPNYQEMAQHKKILDEVEKEFVLIKKEERVNEENEEQLVREQKEKRTEIKSRLVIVETNMNKMKREERINLIKEKKISVVMKCIKEDCRGFLSDNYKCGICEMSVCKDCHTQKEDELGGCNSKNDIECIMDNVVIPIEIKKSKTPDWTQCSIKYDCESKKWIGSSKNKIPEKSKNIFAVLTGVFAGGLSGLLGLGGGIIMVPLFRKWLGLPIKNAVATSLICVGCFAVPGTITHALENGIDWRFALWLTAGVVVGAPLGSKMALKMSDKKLQRVFGLFLAVISIVYGLGELLAL